MINANELRIGNLIEANGPMMEVKAIYEDHVELYLHGSEADNWDEDLETCNGIILTSYLLNKYWGKRKKIKGVSRIRDIDDPEPEGDTEYWDRGQFTIVRWNKGDFVLSTSHGFSNRIILKYLHQLQNLYFALTGTELNYTP